MLDDQDTVARMAARSGLPPHEVEALLLATRCSLQPLPEIFPLMLRRCRREPARTVFIDDVGGDVAAAVACGMHGIVFRNAADCAVRLAAIGDGELAVASGET